MKKENFMKMIDLYVVSHKSDNEELQETEASILIKEVLDSELDELYQTSVINSSPVINRSPVDHLVQAY